MKEIILLKSGEMALKGQNRSTFEDILVQNSKRALANVGRFKITKAQSALYATPVDENCDLDEAVKILGKVFGLSGLVRAAEVEKDFEVIKTSAVQYLKEMLESAKTFKVEAKRSDKSFPLKSPEIAAELGGHLLDNFANLSVDVRNPEVTVVVEIRDFGAYIHAGQIPGAGGLPVRTSGKAAVLISGGIDSPVAAYLMAKRGLEIEAIHFAAPPYTSERAKLKVVTLCEKVAQYAGRVKVTVVNFTKIQETIKEKCPEELFTIIMRRQMMIIAEKIAAANGSAALITGESLAQVASQTIMALACTNAAVQMPVFRPLIGFDKTDIIEIARKIDTFETSILPYEDCCTIFTPRHPKTKPTMEQVLKAEEKLLIDGLIAEAIETVETITTCRQ